MKEFLGNLVQPLAVMVYNAFFAIPLWAVKAGIFTVLAALALWILRMPPQVPEDDTGGLHLPVRDLRYFAATVLALQAVLYIIF